MNVEGRPQAPSQPAAKPTSTILPQPTDIVPLGHGLAAVYVRDVEDKAIALRQLKRNRSLTPEQRDAYREWIAEQQPDAS